MSYKTDFSNIESSIRDYWKGNSRSPVTAQPNQNKSYVLGMFPYPSGNSHMGHVRVFTISDVLARMERFKGKQVLHPLGWDGFGMPAENAAIKNKTAPWIWTEKNIATMRDEQLSTMGFSFDMAHEINTSSPEYYKWSQWLFLKLWKKGLVYREKTWVNWDPVDQTVLANEQVIDGKGWRSGVAIERRQMDQWHIRITDYADDLYKGIDNLKGWSDAARSAQRNWIGRKEGALIHFPVEDVGFIDVFSTNPEMIYGTAAIILAPEHPLLEQFVTPNQLNAVRNYATQALKRSDVDRLQNKDSNGVFTGRYALHPLTKEQIPIFVSDKILQDQGAHMAVPAHDQRDLVFARNFNLPVIPVIEDQEKEIIINSDDLNGHDALTARKIIIQNLESVGLGKSHVSYRLRDWAIGRQRFWGCPIPMALDKNENWIPVREQQLPVFLSESTGQSEGKLERSEDSLKWHDFQTGEDLILTSDTMDTFMCSAWYIFRFLDPNNNNAIFDRDLAKDWLPVDYYVGGLEHANQHLIYLRFMSHFLYDLDLLPTKEPILNFLDNGLVRVQGAKMSKSKGNEVRPDEMVEKYGADALRLFIMSDEPFRNDLEWNENGVQHKQEFLFRLERLYTSVFDGYVPNGIIPIPDNLDDKSMDIVHQLKLSLELIERNILESQHFHTAVAKIHEMTNFLRKQEASIENDAQRQTIRYALQQFLKPLGLFSPHFSELMWQKTTGLHQSLFKEAWPDIQVKEPERQLDICEIPFMIDGRLVKKKTLKVSFENAHDEIHLREAFHKAMINGNNDVSATMPHAIENLRVIPNADGSIRMINFVTSREP